MDELAFYRRQSRISDPGPHDAVLDGLPDDVESLGALVRGAVVHRDETQWLFGFPLPESRHDDAKTRHAAAILDRLGDLRSRPPSERFAGTCRDFSLLLCALLRRAGVPARLRAGFAGYFKPGAFDDHWVVEYHDAGHGWRLADAQLAGFARAAYEADIDPLDVSRDQFLVGGQAWLDCRAGRRDPDTFGVLSAGIVGMWEVQGNVLRDLAALNRVETLPWDDWGLIGTQYSDLAADELALLDRAALVSAAGGPLDAALDVYRDAKLRVPAELA